MTITCHSFSQLRCCGTRRRIYCFYCTPSVYTYYDKCAEHAADHSFPVSDEYSVKFIHTRFSSSFVRRSIFISFFFFSRFCLWRWRRRRRCTSVCLRFHWNDKYWTHFVFICSLCHYGRSFFDFNKCTFCFVWSSVILGASLPLSPQLDQETTTKQRKSHFFVHRYCLFDVKQCGIP